MYKISVFKNDKIFLENGYLEFIYFNYVIINIPNDYLDNRLIIDIFDNSFKIILDDEFSDFINFLQKQKFDKSKFPLCNCFFDLVCADCLFIDCIDPFYSEPIYNIKNKYMNFYKYSIKYLTSKRQLRYTELTTDSLILNKESQKPKSQLIDVRLIKQELTNYRSSNSSLIDIKKIIDKLETSDYITILRILIQQNINEMDFALFLYHYRNTNNEELYLYNEYIIEFLIKNQQKINLFFIIFGEVFSKLNFTSNLFKLLNDLFQVSEFRMREICVSYNIISKILNYHCNNNVEQMYINKFINKFPQSFIDKYVF